MNTGHVTLADIAREAGTSPSTASRALTGRGYVSEEARLRLREAAERLGYVPDASARTLKQRTSRVVGVAVSDLGNQFYANLATGIEQTLREADYQMVLVSDNSDRDRELACARTFLALRATGMIITPADGAAAGLLARHGLAVVEVDRRLADVACDAVVIDNERGAKEATLHLLGQGHRKIALLVADGDWPSNAVRQGYVSAHHDAGIQVDGRLILRHGFQAPDAEVRIAALIGAHEPTAIFAADNLLAEHAWQVLRRLRLRVPTDVSFVGFDDVPWMAMVDPGITVVAQPSLELGRRAAQLLLRRAADPTCPPALEILEPTLVVRASAAPPRPTPRLETGGDMWSGSDTTSD